MNDLRSLEGIGQVLSQKLNRTKLTKSRNRNHSDPLTSFIPNSNDDSIISTPTRSIQHHHGQHNRSDSYNNQNHYDISTPICEYFPTEIAQLLSTNIQNGYNQSLQSQPPKLVKSISDCGNFNDLNWFNCSPHDYNHNNNQHKLHNIAYNNDNKNNTIDNDIRSNNSIEFQSHSQKPSFPSLTTITTGSNFTYYDDADDDEDEDTIFELQLPMDMGETSEFPAFESPPMIIFDSPPPISFMPPPSLAPIKLNPELPQTLSQTMAPSTPYQGLCLDLNEDECNHTSTSKSNDNIHDEHNASFQPLITSKDEPISFIQYHDDQKQLETDTDDDTEDEDDIEFINFKDDYMEYITKNKVNNIGTGASGIVTKAFHYNSCKMVAIKQCRSKQKHESKSFIKEAKLYAQFEDNENIINVLDFGRDIINGELKMALEYMDLGSSDSLHISNNDKLNWKYRENIVGHIILNLLNGLKDLHKLGYIHNDIKPANILCNKYGEIKLSDFGLVSKLDYKNDIYFHKKNCGTQRYQSPEKLIKSPKYNTKSDIWSIGVTAFELLFGIINGESELWYISGNATNVLNGHSSHSHSLSNECCDFINKCLIPDDESRPNIEELLQHSWLKYIKSIDNMKNKWPWIKLIDNKQINIDELYNMNTIKISPSSPSPSCTHSEQHEMKRRATIVSFESLSKRLNDMSLPQTQQTESESHNKYYNGDLLFMISALIIHYCQKNIDLTPNGSSKHESMHQVPNESGYCDDERISNIAHYALCSKEMVINRIQRTVYYIKSQLNNPEISRVDS